MKKTSKYRATFFRRTLCMLLALVLTFGDLGMGVRAAMNEMKPGTPETAAQAAEGSTEEATWDEIMGSSEGSTPILFNSYTISPLDIYNHLYYTSPNQVVTQSSGSYAISGENVSTDTATGKEIIIGNHPQEGKTNTDPLIADIRIFLQGLTMSAPMTVKPVGSENQNRVLLAVTQFSQLGALVVEDNARLVLILNADLTVDSITLGENTSLTVSGSGNLTVTGDFISQGTVALNGGIIQAHSGISARSLSLNGTKIYANGQAVTGSETLSMADSTVEDASLFGYTGESGTRTLTLSGNNNTFTNVTAVGCLADSRLKVSVEGIDTVTSSGGTTYYRDYTIGYQSNGTPIETKADWPIAYRVSTASLSFSGAAILGYHTASSYTAASSIPLPSDSLQPGYQHLGWKMVESEQTIAEITASGGDITLTAVLEANAVSVLLEKGYTPDRYSNDLVDGKLPEKTSVILSKMDQTVSLPVPTRFGYKFKGWKITTGTKLQTISYTEGTEMSYTVAIADCTTEGGQSVVKMEAQWEEDQFNLTLSLGSQVQPDNNLEISIDGGTTWYKFKELKISKTPSGTDAVTGATVGNDFTINGRNIQFSSKWPIKYGDNISEYLRKVFKDLPVGTMPLLRDATTGNTQQNFAGWSTAVGTVGSETVFSYGENGILTPGGKSLAEYQTDLHKNPASIGAVWGIMSYVLILPDSMPDGWTLTYTGPEGNSHTVKPGDQTVGIKVQQDSAVTLTTSSSNPKNFSLWGFSQKDGGKIVPTEQPYKAGEPNLTYQFTMPAADVTATYGKGQEIWINIGRSPILFQENVSYNNRTCSGFWYADTIDGMTHLFRKTDETLPGTDASGTALGAGAYFYQWSFADKFCVTSDGKPTKNQLTLVNALTGGVYLKDVNLAMRDAYVNHANGSLLKGKDCESSQDEGGLSSQAVENSFKNVNLADCANIVLDINKQSSYPTTLHFVGANNTVGAIMHNTLQISNYSPLKLEGDEKDSSAVKLGAAFGYFKYDVTNITVTEYTKEAPANDFKYLLYGAHQAGFQVKSAVIVAPHKNVHAGFLMNADEKASFEDSKVELYSICVFEGVEVINSYLRVLENARFGRIPIQLKEKSKVVIDGNLEMNFHHMNDRGDLTDDTDNWLVVKGTFCDISNYSWQSGTLICNNLVLGRTGGVKGGTVITNQITSQAVGFWSYDKDQHTYTYDPLNNRKAVEANENNDNYPFLVYNQNAEEPNTYTFSGGKIYLLGYYQTKDETDKNGKVTKKYDSTVEALDADNPVAPFMNPLLDGNGDLRENLSNLVSTDAVETAVRTSTRTSNECVVLGNSSEYYSTRRFVEISGSQIYAAGNITFYNDTTVSGGSIYCNGSFGSKGDLTVTGGSITATAVGNAYNLKTTMEDGTLRWKRTDIQGGAVTADRIGAFAKRVSDTGTPAEADQPKSTVTIGTGATICAPEGATGTDIVHDVYINYIFDEKLFDNNGTPTNPISLRFETRWEQGKAFANQVWTNTALLFTAPQVKTGSDGNWNWDSLTGAPVDAITAAGIAQNDGADLPGEKSAYDRVQMKLYAVKQNYDLIFKAGANEITAITCNGATVTKTNTDGKTTAPVKAGGNVVLTFANEQMAKDKTVLWYIDGSSIIHSVNPTVSGSQISFNMPNSDVEVYVTDNMTLDLDVASYTLLQDGFRTEANNPKEREDSEFHYLGNLVIQQGSIGDTEISFNIESGFEGKYQMRQLADGKETQNKILVDKDFNNTASGGRTVTLTRIYQTGTTTSHGVDLEDGAKAIFLLDGAIRICRVRVPEHSDFTLIGKNNDRTVDAIYPIVIGRPESNDWAAIGNFDGPAGNITLQDLTILGENTGLNGSLGYSKSGKTNTVKYMNCVYKTETNGKSIYGWHDRGYFARYAGTVIFDGCEFTFRVSRDWPGYFCDWSKEIYIQNGSKITVTHNGAYDGNPGSTFYAKTEKLVIEDSELNLSLRVPGGEDSEKDGRTYRVWLRANLIPPIELKGNATLVLEQHAILKQLVIGGTSTVKVGQNGDGYLLCQDIQVNGSAKLQAGGIIVSGFYNGAKDPQTNNELQTKSDFLKAMAEGKYIFDGSGYSGLVVNGGTVTATEYITGDVNGKITVTGGTVTAPKIGTTGYLYGYTQYVPRVDEEYIYTYERIPVGMTILIAGGQVNVSENLGGMKSTVEISGGEVNLGENAVLGLTEEQQTTLYNYATANQEKPGNFGSLTITGGKVEGAVTGTGDAEKGGSISVPYGTVDVSGANTAISVYDMTAYCGEMTVTGVKGQFYDNPYTGSDKITGQEKLGILVANLMSAKNLTITGGSVVYAKSAYANVPKGEKGHITVIVDGADRAYLYTSNAYGVIGEGEGNYEYNDGTGTGASNKNVFGTKVVDVQYIIQPGDVFLAGDIGKENNPNEIGLPYYTVVSSNAESAVRYYTLQDACCSGYEFLGWYQYDPVKKTLTDTRVTQIDKSNAQDVYLGAKWKRVEVEFEIRIWVDSSEYDEDTMELIENGSDGKNLYKFKQTAKILYGDPILSESGILLSHYTTKTQGVQAVAYNGITIGQEVAGQSVPNTRVSAAMADAFVDSNAPLILMVPEGSLTVLNALITLSQNKNDKGKPLDTNFNLSVGTLNSGNNSTDLVSAYGSITGTLGDIPAFTKDGKLIKPNAPGYRFDGWYTDKEFTNQVTAETELQRLYDAKTTTLYAKWTPNTYIVRFSANTVAGETNVPALQWVTAEETAPGVNADAIESMDYYWTYDTAPSASGGGFWVKKDGGETEYKTKLPCAWREGYFFEHWQFTDAKGTHIIDSGKELSQALMANLKVDNYVGSSGTGPALTLYAQYRQVKVTYHLNGGSWMTVSDPTPNPTYGDALPGYSKESDLTENTGFTKLGPATGADGKKYCVISTTSGYYATHSAYVDGDYRKALSKKGYTFQGWQKAGDTTYYGCTPRFEDLELTAQWMPNKYTLNLHVKDNSYSSYVSSFNTPNPATVDIMNVTVGSPISSDSWPKKQDWYAMNSVQETNAEKRRLLLGVTFAALDPGNSSITTGDSVYLRYAKAVTNMFNSKTLFDQGSTFFLPKDDDYNNDLAQAIKTKDKMSSVPDYPDGSTIPMYGVYRERSLVFIETYVDSNGVTQSQVMYSSPWNEYSDYPTQYQTKSYGEYTYLTGHGYALAGWFVGEATIDESRQYTKNNFDSYKDNWKGNAGTRYDINVYTVYVAQQSIPQELTAVADPTGSTLPVSYTLPGSMQEGALSYQIISGLKGLNLVSVEQMKMHQYDSKWQSTTTGKTYTANDTVAIELKLQKGETTYTVDLMDAGKQLVSDQHIGKGWMITLTLYHSKVMTEAPTYSYSFTIDYTFESEKGGAQNTLKDQWLKSNVKVVLTPSLYDVEYRVDLPESEDRLTVLKENGFTKTESGNAYHYTVKQAYGSNLLPANQTLILEGYDREANWKYNTAARTNLTLEGVSGQTDEAKKAELSDGKITVYAGYAAKSYTLEKIAAVENGNWKITYGNGANDTEAASTLGESSANVKYHSTVTITPIGSQPAAFITLTYTDSESKKTVRRLDQYATKQDGSYTFSMPARNMTVGYSDVMDLYLDNGTIELFPEGFKQVKKYEGTVSWPGNYRILQCAGDNSDFHSTEYVLILSGNLIGDGNTMREVSLGRLNINSPNSIELKDNCAVNLTQTGEIEAKNILVPEGSALTVTGDRTQTITLTPDEQHAAIGGFTNGEISGESGAITLDNVDLSMTLKAPSAASGIGPGSQDCTGSSGAVKIENSQITVTENANASGQYTGAWIGGAGVTSVTMEGTTLADGGGSNHNAKAVDGATAFLTNCQIGENVTPVMEPIHAANSLTVTDCQIYQQNNFALTNLSMIGTDTGSTAITRSTVQIGYGGGGWTSQLFTGQLLIQDPQSDITINGTQILEVSHGSITIDESGVTQGDQAHRHSGLSYLLLEEKEMPATSPSLTVEGLGTNKTITVQKPTTGNTVTVGVLEIQDDAKVILNGNLNVTDAASVAKDHTLTVEGSGHGVTYRQGLSGEGNYTQTGGSLMGNADVVVKGNMTLTNVTANCTGHAIGSSGGSATTATTVTISDGSVTASTIGACGNQNDTFTFVKTENDPTINGNLVQDHYRLNYVVSGENVGLTNLPTVLRTETTAGTATVYGSIPANPTDVDQFKCWFIWNEDGTQRLGLLEGTDVPPGLKGTTLLSGTTASKGMSAPAADGTKTLSVYAWLDLSGTAVIQSGRLFKTLTGNDKTVSVSSRGAWTAMLVSNGTFISGRDYHVTFAQPLPAGTDLTLTVVSASGNQYYHLTLESAANQVMFSQFTKMGTQDGTPPALTDSNAGQETFLLSVDFGELTDSTVPTGGDINFSVRLGDDTTAALGDPAEVSYQVTEVKLGALEASTNTVTVMTQPSGEERRTGKTVYLVGTLSKADGKVKVPLNASANLTQSGTPISGQWVNGDTVAFALGEYGNLTPAAYTFFFKGLPEGEYSIQWKLCAGELPNVLNGGCSNIVSSAIRVSAQTPPSLKVTLTPGSRVLAAGSAHTVSFNYETNASSFTVTVEKQGILANFDEIESTEPTITPDTVTVVIPGEPGTYRVCFSLNEDSENDNVYYSFIVE